uniref:tRNA methyltransferase 11 homolog n=1 Tax=Phocoena sinus TaxID=42100 RepID=A0A8C9BJ82_PHOSS
MALPGPVNRYLLLMAQEHLEFRLPEIKSLLSLFGGQFTNSQETYGKSPFWILSIPSEDIARNLMKRTVCAKSIFELWGHGKSPEELYNSLKNYPVEKMVPFLHSDSTYKIKIHTFNKTLTQEEKIKRIDALEFLPFEGKVNLKKPQHIFSILEDYGLDPNCIPENPHNIYFGRWIADGQRELIESYSVKKRHFIGNTSMDAGLSFIMANHGKVKENDIVFDPFVGTAVYSKLGLLKTHSNQMDKVLFKEHRKAFVFPLTTSSSRWPSDSICSFWCICIWDRHRLQHRSWLGKG